MAVGLAAIASCVTAGAIERYVSLTGGHVPPFLSWDAAATSIQAAVDAAVDGDTIWVTNGTYATGGRAVYGTMTNRVAVDKPLTLRSVNGPQFTVIRGYQVPGTTNGDGAIRCVYLTNGASLSGFTLTNGATRRVGFLYPDRSGGGLWCNSAAAVVSNSVVVGNSADYDGGGAWFGTLNNCTLSGNSAGDSGGAVFLTTLNNCTLIGNSAGYGGGAAGSTLNNCTLTGNSAMNYGGGVNNSTLTNCVLYYNTAPSGANLGSLGTSLFGHCCTTPQPTSGAGNFTNAPLFVDFAGGNLRLQSNSPCINAGNNAFASTGTDLDGNPRIVGTTVDVGAYEFQSPASALSYAWAQQYSLPTDGSADMLDSDGDGLNNWQESRCLTDPTNALSVLRLLSASPAGTNVAVSWQSVPGLSYFLERSADLSATPRFTPLATNVTGQTGPTTIFTDTNAASVSPRFYRVGVGN